MFTSVHPTQTTPQPVGLRRMGATKRITVLPDHKEQQIVQELPRMSANTPDGAYGCTSMGGCLSCILGENLWAVGYCVELVLIAAFLQKFYPIGAVFTTFFREEPLSGKKSANLSPSHPPPNANELQELLLLQLSAACLLYLRAITSSP
ncbi:uncharacterized protein EMH_0040590 [Eimeria mitis]|uniref:Uncharacterized protein n=1 Tax=Eimeria mitis TaxID=44415 RepID=U6KD91_9EIME|nr:uncharacterized protein EMH_0040590 [Eimeria mitis]CDJ35894.1 hypothetical protein EMH_0040590 [Eimeria mitis]